MATTYGYDDSNQLLSDGASTYTLDAAGNRSNDGNQAAAGNQLTTDGTWDYSYDNEGNLIKKVMIIGGVTWKYAYDHANQMISAKHYTADPDVGAATLLAQTDYKYDWYGNRLQKDFDTDGNASIDKREKYLYDGWKTGPQQVFAGQENWDLWGVLDSGGAVLTRYLQGNDIDQTLAYLDYTRMVSSKPTVGWLLPDHLGSVRAVMDNSAVVQDVIVYGGWGNIVNETHAAPWGDRFKWTGREFDAETGLQYNRARYYDPVTGRWQSQDPLGFAAGDSNLYRYAFNAPTNWTDPSGNYIFFPDQESASNWVLWFNMLLPKMQAEAEPVGNSGYFVLNPSTNAVNLIQGLSFYANAPEMQKVGAAVLSPTLHIVANATDAWTDLQFTDGIPKSVTCGAMSIVAPPIGRPAPTISWWDQAQNLAKGLDDASIMVVNGMTLGQIDSLAKANALLIPIYGEKIVRFSNAMGTTATAALVTAGAVAAAPAVTYASQAIYVNLSVNAPAVLTMAGKATLPLSWGVINGVVAAIDQGDAAAFPAGFVQGYTNAPTGAVPGPAFGGARSAPTTPGRSIVPAGEGNQFAGGVPPNLTTIAPTREIPPVIYREGRPNPGTLTPRPGDNGHLSFRDSLTNPIQPGTPGPLPSPSGAQRPVLRPGEPYIAIDTSRLPPGSVIPDGVPGRLTTPPGHVSVVNVPPLVLKNAVIGRGKFP